MDLFMDMRNNVEYFQMQEFEVVENQVNDPNICAFNLHSTATLSIPLLIDILNLCKCLQPVHR